MPIDVLMPQLSPTMTEGRLAKWLKQVGDKIAAGDVIAEVETDKATMEVEASDDGVIHQIIGKAGEDMPVGMPIAVLKKNGETVAADYVPTSKAKGGDAPKEAAGQATGLTTGDVNPVANGAVGVETPASTQRNETVQAVPVVSTAILPKINVATMATQPAAAVREEGERVAASPLARRLAAQKGVALSDVMGSGPHGRVVAADVEKAPQGGYGGNRPITRQADVLEKLTPMRKAIASRLLASKQTVPHFYLSANVRMDALLDLRKQLNARLEAKKVKLTVNDFIVKACALGLRDHPAANAAWNGDSVVMFGNVDISVAVAIEGGLITPVVANADQKSLVALSGEVKQLAAAAREGKLKPAQYEGGSFSISNLGMYGVDSFSAIINPPQAAIIACGKTSETMVVEHGKPAVAQVMSLTLSVDHRVIDGALGAELLASIKGYLEAPAVMLL